VTPATPQTVEALIRHRLSTALGGWRGSIETALPTVVFVALWTWRQDIRLAAGAAMGIALVLAVVRLAQKSSLTHVLGAVFATGIAAFFALRSGRAEAAFLPGILTNAAYLVGTVFSILARWPAVGFLVGAGDPRAAEDPFGWRKDRGMVAVCSRLTWVLVGVYAIRLLIMVPLYLAAEATIIALPCWNSQLVEIRDRAPVADEVTEEGDVAESARCQGPRPGACPAGTRRSAQVTDDGLLEGGRDETATSTPQASSNIHSFFGLLTRATVRGTPNSVLASRESTRLTLSSPVAATTTSQSARPASLSASISQASACSQLASGTLATRSPSASRSMRSTWCSLRSSSRAIERPTLPAPAMTTRMGDGPFGQWAGGAASSTRSAVARSSRSSARWRRSPSWYTVSGPGSRPSPSRVR
jgi:hypothetical protein